MRWIDDKFRRDPKRYVLQTLLAFVAIAAIVIGLGALTRGTIVAALGASAFVVFAMPEHDTAKSRRLIGGHVVCIAIGLVCSIPFRLGWIPTEALGQGLMIAAAVSLAIFAMAITNTEHPPAAGNALAFTIERVDLAHVLFILGAVVLLAAIRHLLRRWLRDLAF